MMLNISFHRYIIYKIFLLKTICKLLKKNGKGSKSPIVQVVKGIVILERENCLQIKKNNKISKGFCIYE